MSDGRRRAGVRTWKNESREKGEKGMKVGVKQGRARSAEGCYCVKEVREV